MRRAEEKVDLLFNNQCNHSVAPLVVAYITAHFLERLKARMTFSKI